MVLCRDIHIGTPFVDRCLLRISVKWNPFRVISGAFWKLFMTAIEAIRWVHTKTGQTRSIRPCCHMLNAIFAPCARAPSVLDPAL